ncbi:GAF and ANTAR domain-containing protein [Amycolatopsis halotolerans]|uniref:GAF and ANTAR domain-containing protein n=1 Tax=Amycolatopsis halotolerans TaxID=330083 RepID=A0ABV7QUU1_9PSEU
MPATERETLVAEAVLNLAARERAVPDLMHDLTTSVAALVGVRAAGVAVLDETGKADCLAISDEAFLPLARSQFELGEGPAVDSIRTGAVLPPVTLRPAGTGPQRWPRFSARALRAGVTRVAAVPLRAGEHAVGTVTLFSTTPSVPVAQDLRLAQVLADAAGAGLSQKQALRTKDESIGQLRSALNSRVVIEQAKGILAAHLSIEVGEAFDRLRSHARARRLKLSELAGLVVRGEIPSGLRAIA